MGLRLDLQELLVGILESGNVYFQPPENTKIEYPCIVYKRDFILLDWADNKSYLKSNRYLVTTIDRDPDSLIPDKIAALPNCVYDRFYTVDNLNHNVFKLFF
jgi:hypothetical protein